MASTSQAIGFLGGRFDPVHTGHLHLALDSLESLGLDKVYFVPSEQTPLKGTKPGASAADRLAVLEHVAAIDSRLDILTWELEQGGGCLYSRYGALPCGALARGKALLDYRDGPACSA